MSDGTAAEPPAKSGLLDWIERVGNRLPHPMTLFIVGAIVILLLSQVAASLDWTVEKTVMEKNAAGVEVQKVVEVKAVGLLAGDGAFWAISNMVKNFTAFPPLGVVLVGMLGIGIAERTGAISALLKLLMLHTPKRLLTPAMIFIGILSSMGLDAGYIILPPIAAALYKAVGRSPLVGLAAVFVGVAAGFSANIVPTGLDPLLAGFTTTGAQFIASEYEVAATANLGFMVVSTFALTLVGWAVTSWFVEPRFAGRSPDLGGPSPLTEEDEAVQQLTDEERRGLIAAGKVLGVFSILILLMVNPWGVLPYEPPLHGNAGKFPRWVVALVPLLFFFFLLPGLAYGFASRTIKSDHDVAKMMGKTMAEMGPYIVLAFFAAQFVAYFGYSKLGEMMAIKGGEFLAAADMPPWLLISAFVLLVMVANLFIGSASAKYAFFAPVFVPMFMVGGNISPELTQAAYRVGDSCSNIITPLNPYMVIILVFLQKYMPKGGIGTLVALMLPYAIVFGIVWTGLLVLWMSTGMPLGPEGPLWYKP